MTFKIQNEYKETPIDIKIKQLRKEMAIEELRKAERLREEEYLKKKQIEINEMKKLTKGREVLSYDLYGKLSESNTVKKLPSVMFNCPLPQIRTPNCEIEEAKLTMRKTLMKIKTIKKVSTRAIDISVLLTEANKLPKKNKDNGKDYYKFCPLKSTYDLFRPEAGVTFYESGLNVKESAITLNEKLGKFNKTEFQSQVSEASLHPNSALTVNSSIWSNKGQENEGRNKDSGRLSKYILRKSSTGNNARIDVTGDLSQLWEDPNKYNQFKSKGKASISPAIYVPQKKRLNKVDSIKNIDRINPPGKSNVDLFNMTITSGLENGFQSDRGHKHIAVLRNPEITARDAGI